MRKFNVYVIRDVLAELYSERPFVTANDLAAKRLFSDLVNEKGGEVNKHPEDYSLYRVGSYDRVTGIVQGTEPIIIAQASELIRKEVLNA